MLFAWAKWSIRRSLTRAGVQTRVGKKRCRLIIPMKNLSGFLCTIRIHCKPLFFQTLVTGSATFCVSGVFTLYYRTKDDYVGCSEFPVRHIATSAERSYSGSVPLSRGKGKPAGFLNVTIRFYGSVVDSTQKAGGNQAKQNTPNATEQPPQPCMMYPGQWPNAVAAPPMMGYPPPQAYVRNPGMPMMVPPQGFPMNPPMMAQPAAAMGVYPPQPQQYMQYNPHQPMQPQMPLQQMMMPQGGHPPNQPPGMYPQTMQYMPPQNNGYSPNNGPPKEWQM